MVKHAHNKKRRAGWYGKVKKKQRTWNRYNPNPTIPNQVVKKLWDPSKSATINMAEMGLSATPNDGYGAEKISRTAKGSHALSSTSTGTNSKEKPNVIELFDIPQSDTLVRKSRPFPVDKQDEIYIAKCLAKWGTNNYQRMFRDTKRGVGVNENQYTEEVLRKMASRFLLLTPEQRQVPVPDKVQDELPNYDHSNDDNVNNKTMEESSSL